MTTQVIIRDGSGLPTPSDAASMERWFGYEAEFLNRGYLNNIDWATSAAVGLLTGQTVFSNISIEHRATISLPESGIWQFGLSSDDSAEVIVDGTIVASFYGGRSISTGAPQNSGSISLSAGPHLLRFRVQQGTQQYGAKLWWRAPSAGSFSVVPAGALNSPPFAPPKITLRVTDGSSFWELPDAKGTPGFEFSNITALELTYPRDGVNASQIAEGRTVIAYVDGVEPKNARWIIKGKKSDDAKTEEDSTWTCRSLASIFEKVVCYPQNGDFNNPTEWTFSASSVGGLLIALFNNAQARGAMSGITFTTFTNAVDSNGAAWDKSVYITYRVGVKYLDILNNLVDQGIAEWEFQGNSFKVYNANGLGVDRTLGSNPVILNAGEDYIEAPVQTSIEGAASHALIQGDEGKLVLVTDAGNEAAWGHNEVFLSQGGTADVGTLTYIAQAELDKSLREQLTRGLDLSANRFYPLIDYQVGDWVYDNATGTPEKVRVRALSLEIESDGTLDGSITMNDMFLEQEIRLARKVNGILGGASNVNATQPPSDPATDDFTTPNAPSTPGMTSGTYIEQTTRDTKAVVRAVWTAPTTNTNGSAITDLQDYEFQWKLTSEADTAYRSIITAETFANFSPVPVNTSVSARVRARDLYGHVSAWSGVGTHTTSSDNIAPNVPSTPIVNSKNGVVSVSWDGRDNAANIMLQQSPDFDHINVHYSTTSGFTPGSGTVQAAIINGPGTVAFSNLVNGTTYYFKFTAVDRIGNESAGSTQASATVAKVTGADIAADTVTANNIATGAITAVELAADAVSAKHVQVGVLSYNLIRNPGFEDSALAGWTFTPGGGGGGAGIAYDFFTNARTGKGNAYLTTNAAQTESIATTDVMPVRSSRTYNFRMWALEDAVTPEGAITAQYRLSVDGSTWGSWTNFTEIVAVALESTTWTEFIGNFTTGASDLYAQVRFLVPAHATLNRTVYIDDVSLIQQGYGATSIAPDGLRIWDSEGNLAVALLAGAPMFITLAYAGVNVASIDQEGNSAFETVRATSGVSAYGLPLVPDPETNPVFPPYVVPDDEVDYDVPWVDKVGRGIIAWGKRDTSGTNTGTTEQPYLQVNAILQGGRLYRIRTSQFYLNNNTANGRTIGTLRWKIGYSTQITTTDTTIGTVGMTAPGAGGANTRSLDVLLDDLSKSPSFYNSPDTRLEVQFLLSYYAEGGTTGAIVSGASYPVFLYVEDVGPAVPDTGIDRTALPQKYTYSSIWRANWTGVYKGDSAADPTAGSEWYQGYFDSNHGNHRSLFGFTNNAVAGETTRTIQSALSTGTVTINWMKIYVYANHWYNPGSRIMVYGFHKYTNTSAPASWADASVDQNLFTTIYYPNPGGYWRDVPLTSTMRTSWINGTYRGVALGPAPSTSHNYYGRGKNHSAGSYAPHIQINYSRVI